VSDVVDVVDVLDVVGCVDFPGVASPGAEVDVGGVRGSGVCWTV
jgi:hypothetical protein